MSTTKRQATPIRETPPDVTGRVLTVSWTLGQWEDAAEIEQFGARAERRWEHDQDSDVAAEIEEVPDRAVLGPTVEWTTWKPGNARLGSGIVALTDRTRGEALAEARRQADASLATVVPEAPAPPDVPALIARATEKLAFAGYNRDARELRSDPTRERVRLILRRVLEDPCDGMDEGVAEALFPLLPALRGGAR